MKALTIQQPWTWLLLSGHVNHCFEPFPGKPKVRGYLMIHAGMSYDWDGAEWITRTMGVSIPIPLPHATILGYARLTSVLLATGDRPPPATGGFKFRFTDVHSLSLPVTAVAGRRGFWPVPTRARELINLPNHVRLSLI